MCKKIKRKLLTTDLGTWLSLAQEDRQVSEMDSVSSIIRCYHAQQAIEKLLKAAIIANKGEFLIDCPEIAERRKQHPPDENIAQLKMPPCAWVLPPDFDFPFTHDLCELWELLQGLDRTNFKPLSESESASMKKATKFAIHYRYPAYRDDVGLFVGYVSKEEVDEMVSLVQRIEPRLRDYVRHFALPCK
jgi:HEPN domain-containing protein